MRTLASEYKKKKSSIKKRLRDFENIGKKPDDDIFQELIFCVLTPQSKAVNCDRAVKELKKRNLLFTGSAQDIKPALKSLTRFHNKKAEYLVAARKLFKNGAKINIKKKLTGNIFKIREWLVKNIKGLGYKEASHFLRNVGLGSDIAIIDRHVIRNLKKERVVKKVPETITKKNYLEIENKMREFAKKNNIPLAALDLLFWSNETGFIFK